MNSGGSSWLPPGLMWINPNTWRFSKEKKGRALREQINAISQSSALDDAGIDDDQVLTLTREDLNELYPGIRNFHLRRTIMSLITDTVKDSLQSGPETFSGALKHLMQQNNSNDAAVQDVLKESLRAFREMEEQLKTAQASLKPYIEVLNSLTEASAKKEHWDTGETSSRRKLPSSSQTDLKSPTVMTPPLVRVYPFICGRTMGVDKQILVLLKGVEMSELLDCQLILIFCPIVSRHGTDVEDALRKISANKPAVLVMLHHTFNPNFACPSCNVTSEVNIVERVNVLFHDSQNGLLMCAHNESAIGKLQSVLYRYM